MKKNIILICFSFIVSFSAFAQDSTFIKIILPQTDNWKVKRVGVSYTDEVFMEKFVEIDFEQTDTSKNEWFVKISVNQPYNYFFGIDKKVHFSLLTFPNDSVEISFDEEGKPTFLKGKTAKENQATYNITTDYFYYCNSLEGEEWEDYIKKVNERKEKIISDYQTTTKEFTTNPIFEDYFYNELTLQTVNAFRYYTHDRTQYLKNNNLPELPQEYYEQKPKLNIIVKDNFPYSQEYTQYIYTQLSEENCKENEDLNINETSFCMCDYITSLEESKLKKLLLLNAIYYTAHRIMWDIKEQETKFDEKFNEIKNKYPNDDRIEFIENKVTILKRFAKGQSVPNFSLKSKDGKIVSLTDLKGKYVLIDFWGTWCGPCIAEIPHSKKLESEFENKEIVFVYICMRDNEEKWQKHVSKSELNGIQLFANKEETQQLEKDYDVRFYPSFLLLDKEGKIVTRRFRPSYNGKEVLEKIFEEE